MSPRDAELPNPGPRPPGEVEQLERIWKNPTGWRFLSVVDNNYIGALYIATAFVFFVLAGLLAVGAILWWLWQTDKGPDHPPQDVGGGYVLPVYLNGSQSHSWWAVVTLLFVDGTAFASLLWAYVFLWTVSPEVWPADAASLPGLGWLAAGLALWAAMDRAIVWAILAFLGLHAAVLLLLMARSFAGLLHAGRRVTFDNTMLMWRYTAAQAAVGLVVLHLFPRAAG